jgi:hypothetical protein
MIQLALGNTNFSFLPTLSNNVISPFPSQKAGIARPIRLRLCKEKQTVARGFPGTEFFSGPDAGEPQSEGVEAADGPNADGRTTLETKLKTSSGHDL